MDSYRQHYIDGAWVDSVGGTPHQVVNPATEAPCTEITLASAADVDRAVAAAARAFPDFARTSVAGRLALLERIGAAYKARIPDLARAMATEMGAPISFAAAAQAPSGLAHFSATRRALADFAFEETAGNARVVHEPIGVVAMITPWNWPLNQIAAKVAPALAAGNTMVLKPSEEAPGCAAIFAEILHEAGVPAGVFNLVQGDGPTAGAALCAHPDVAMVSFTGSTRAGIAVAAAAAPTVKRVHQELGGKAPNLVLEGADLAAVLPLTVQGVLANSGQSCIAPTRILVHRSQADEAATVIARLMAATAVGDPLAEGKHIGPVVNKAQYDKIQALIASAMEQGATLVAGGPGRPAGIASGYYVRPTLFAGVTPDMRIAQEEIFGPVATLTSYDSEEEAIDLANATVYGLSATLSGDPERAAAIAPRLRAGLVTINSWGPDINAPFGGYKRSGNGRENGRFGLAEFMETKTILGAPAH